MEASLTHTVKTVHAPQFQLEPRSKFLIKGKMLVLLLLLLKLKRQQKRSWTKNLNVFSVQEFYYFTISWRVLKVTNSSQDVLRQKL